MANKIFRPFLILTLLLIIFGLNAQTIVTIGTGTSTNSSSSYPAPYGNYYYGAKHQFLIPAAEIIAAGGGVGTIQSLAFDVATAEGTPLTGFNIKIGTTALSNLTTSFVTGLTQVYITAAYSDVVGWNTHTFSTPFNWDGSSNIIIETCFNNTGWTNNAQIRNTTTTYNSSLYYADDAFGVCLNTTGSTSTVRPNMKLSINMTPPSSNNLSLLEWVSPLAGTTPSSVMPIQVKLFNEGLAFQHSIPLKYSINGGASWVTETYNDTLFSGDTLLYTFSASANMSTAGYYNCIAVVSNPGDTITNRDTVYNNPYLCNTLSGTYIIGSSINADFPTFSDAVFALNNCGINAPVIINVESGTYFEQVTIPEIIGASATNTIIFKSLSGNNSDVILNNNATSEYDNWTLKLDGADYITFRDMTIEASNFYYATVIELINGANYNKFRGNNIVSTGNSYDNKAIYDSYTLNNFNTYTNNKISGGYYGFYVYGNNTSTWETGTVIDSNEITGVYHYGIYAYYQDSIQITNNFIHNFDEGSTGIYSYYNFNGFNLSNNRIIMDGSTSTSYGIKVYRNNYSSYAGASASGLVSNNFITTNNPGTGYGIYAYYSNKVNYYYNSINIIGGTAGYGLYQYNTTSNTTGQSFKNNIFVNSAGGYAAYFGTTSTINTLDYNCYYSAGSNLAYWSGDKTSLIALKTASGKDANSIEFLPAFISQTDLHVFDIELNGLGSPVSVTKDIDGETRNTTTPDIGADEFTPPAKDLSIISWLGNTDNCGLSSTEQVKVEIVNKGTNSQSNFNIFFSVNNGIPITETYTGTILNGDTLNYTFTNTVDLSSLGLHNLKIYTALAGEENPYNDTLSLKLKKVGAITLPFYEDFEDSTNFYFSIIKGSETSLSLTKEYNGDSWLALKMEGKSNTGWNYPTNVTDAFTNNPEHYVKLSTCDINTYGMSALRLMFDYQYSSTYDVKNNWFRVMINDTLYAIEAFSGDSVWQPDNTYDQSDNESLEFDLSAFVGGNITISLEAVLRYNNKYSESNDDAVLIDNIRLWEPTLHDVGVLNVTSSGGQCGAETDSLYALIRNYGLSNETNIPVYCSIQAPDGFHSYNASYTDTIPPFGVDYIYLGTFNTTQNGIYDVLAYTNLSTDITKSNDTARFIGENEHHKIIPHIENFDSQDNDWSTDGFYIQSGGFFGLTSNVLFADVYSGGLESSGSPIPSAPYEAEFRKLIGKVTSASYLVFDYAVMGSLTSYDSIVFSLSDDCRDNYYAVHTIKNTNYYSGTGLSSVAVPIPDYAGEYVNLKVSIFSGYLGSFMFGVDNIGIIDVAQPSLGNDTTLCQGETIVLDAGYNSPTYQHTWTKDGVPLSDTTSTITVSLAGTYIAFIKDSLGFIGSDTIVVNLNSLTTVNILTGLSPNSCANDISTNLTAYPSGGTFSGTGLTGNLFDPSIANIGMNQVVYTYVDGNGCSNSDTTQTMLYAVPNVSISTTLLSSYCEYASTVSLVASPSGGVFTGSGVSGNTFDPAMAYGSVQIIYNYTDGNSCSNSDTISTVVNQNPVVMFTTNLASNYCANSPSISLGAYPAGGTFSGTGVIGNSFDPSIANTGINQVIYNFVDANGCSNSDTIQTNVYTMPNVSISTSLASSYCEDASSISLTASPSGGTFTGSGVIGSTFDPSLAYGSVNILYNYTDANGCSNSDTISTTVNQNPLVIFTTSLVSNYCSNSPIVSLSAYPAGGTFSGDGVSGTTFNPATALTGINELIYTYTNISGCSGADTISTTVNSAPTVTLSSFTDICENQQQLVLSGGSPANGEYNGSGVNPISGIFYPSVTGPGLIPISYSFTDTNGCMNTDSKNIRIVSTPTSNFSIPSNICPNSTASITYQGTAGTSANFAWDFDYGVISSGSGSGPYQISWDTSGIKQLSLIVTDSGCTSTTSYNYTNILSKTASITAIGNTSVCYGDSVIIFANSGIGYSYQWLLNSTILPNDTNSFYAATTAGNYSALVTNNYNCTDTSNTVSVTISPLPIATFNVISNACASDTITVSYIGNATGAATYIWNFDSANVISGSGQGPYQIMWNSSGTKVISLTVSENNCTSSSYSQNVIINTTEAIITVIGNTTFCDGDSVALYANTGANLTHQWFKNNIMISGATNPYYIANSSGSYHVLITNIITGCSETSSQVVITVNTTNFNLAFTATPNSFTAPPFIVSFNNQTPNSSNYYFYWDLGDGNNSTFMQPFHTYQFDGTYDVTLIAENIQSGCRDTLLKPNYISCTGGSPNPCSVVAEITPSGSAIICVTDSLLLTATSGTGWNYQWLYNGVVIPSADTATLYATLAGEYRVIVNDTVCSKTSNPFILGNHPSVIPIISSNDSIRPCTNDSMELYVSTFYNSYLWSTNETTHSIFVKYSGDYTVTTTDIYGCALVSAPFIVNASLLQPPEICIVGVDSLNHNRIIWERSNSALVDSFFIYRESTAAGVYNKIGQVDNSQPSIFVDTNSNPAIRAYRYRLTASDTCGSETSMSPYHKTMHLTINAGLNGAWNLIWDGYVGFPFGSYIIYRGTTPSNITLLTQLPSTLSSYTDLNPPSGTVFYQIEVLKANGCYPDSIFTKVNTNYNSSRSNVADNMTLTPVYLTADFYANILNGIWPIQIEFSDNTIGYPTSWKWNFGDGNTSIEQHPKHTYNNEGLYTVSLIACNGTVCDTITKVDYINILQNGISEINKNINIGIYPNPNNGMFTVDINSYQKNVPIAIGIEIAVYNLLGEKVYADEIQSFKGNHKHSLNLSTLPKGIYQIVVMNAQFKRIGKVVIQ